MADSTTADIEAQLMSLGADADAGRVDPENAPSATATPQRTEETVEQTEAGKEKPAEQQEQTDDASRKTEVEKTEEKPAESKFTKAQKDAARLDKTWQAVNAEKERQDAAKAELETSRAKYEEDRKALEAERQKALPTLKPGERLKDESGKYTAEDYDAYAREIMGDEAKTLEERQRLSENAYKIAAEMRQKEAQASYRGEQQALATEWNKNMEAFAKAHPDLKLADASDPLAKEVGALINSSPEFTMFPTGFEKAVQVAQWKIGAESVAGLQAENEKLNKEVKRLNEAMGITGANPTQSAKAKGLSEMKPDEAEAYMIQLANQADGIAA